MKERKDLLPCPFCGAKAKAHEFAVPKPNWRVSCSGSECWVQPETIMCMSERFARRRWNKQINHPTSCT